MPRNTRQALGTNVPLPSRVNYYLKHPADYSVIFLGDGHTYCAMHPEIIEQYVPQMYGLNLSSFANWFPTQFSMLHDIVAKIPKKTIVVWSVTATISKTAGQIPSRGSIRCRLSMQPNYFGGTGGRSSGDCSITSNAAIGD
jgi:hypothetical protein